MASPALFRLLKLLDLEKTGDNGFRGLSPAEPILIGPHWVVRFDC
ncbi:MAG: hypothetical protein RL274_158 [Pseudomonadota bacterium]|jgi:hypothetical protein